MAKLWIDGEWEEYADNTQWKDVAAAHQERYPHDILLVQVNGKLQELHKQVVDKGKVVFITADSYEAPGTISLPIVMNPQEYEAVIKESQEVEICVNELTGETATAGPSDEEWGDSDDTRFKKVYEGSIYVLKGA